MFQLIRIAFCFLLLFHKIGANYLYPKFADIIPQSLANSYFGYSVQLQINSIGGYGRIIVGAPLANSSFTNQKNLVQPGAVYSCQINTKTCLQIPLDEEGNINETYNNIQYTNHKDNSWFGSSVDNNINGDIVACAPRWIDSKRDKTEKLHRMIGKCYYYDSSKNLTKSLVPLLSHDRQYEGQSYYYVWGEIGFSAHLIQSSSTVILNSVGLYNWTGSIIQYNNLKEYDNDYFIANPVRNDKNPPIYSYFGYVLSSGKFDKNGTLYYVSGAPRSHNLRGMVYITKQLAKSNAPFDRREKLEGEQIGEYFGSAVAVADLNDDGLDDIVVGAPMYFQNEEPELGRIYVYYARYDENKVSFRPPIKITGKMRYGRFGAAISSLGDINKDGYEDIIVGAPYYEEQGAIFIYLGGKQTLSETPDQEIYASDFPSHLLGFGSSFSRGIDIDNNHYNDIAVGSYLSGHVVVLKSRPIIAVTMFLSATPNKTTIDTKYVEIKFCLKYTGVQVPSNLTIKTKLMVQSSNVVFDNKKNILEDSTLYELDVKKCNRANISLVESKSFLYVEMTYEVFENTDKFCELCPVVHNSPNIKSLNINFETGCKNQTCYPNLQLSVSASKSKIIIDSEKELKIEINIRNLGENAFSSKLWIEKSSSTISLAKSLSNCREDNRYINCDIANLITENDARKMELLFDTSSLLATETFSLIFIANSSGTELISEDNKYILQLDSTEDIHLNILSSSYPEQISLLENKTEEITVEHKFHIQNNGETFLKEFDIIISIPKYYNNENIIINSYAVENCETIGEIDSHKLETNNEISSEVFIENGLNLNCFLTNIQCTHLSCKIRGNIRYRDILLKLTINTTSIDILRDDKEMVYITTIAQYNSPYIKQNHNYVKTALINPPKKASITLWVIIGTIVGLLLVILLVFLLYKCKFFNRKKIDKSQETNELLENVNTENDEHQLTLNTIKKLNENEVSDNEDEELAINK